MARIIDSFRTFFRPLSAAQKTLFVFFTVGILTITTMLFYWALQPSYAVLFGSLSPDSAQTIVEELESMGVSYELRDNGQSIMVPRDRVYNLRLRFAGEGASGADYRGYELFDQNTLGMTDFMQRINKKRALEGELARTINNLSQVESSRIHIVMPERSPFQESTVEPSASVILNLKGSRSLDSDQIRGIGALISGSVEGLNSENVVILDQNGNRISEDILMDKELTAESANMRLRQNTEDYLTNKGQSMLDRVLGPGNSILRVSTEHNFDKLVRESDIIDPDSRVVISEEERSSANANEVQEFRYTVEGEEALPVNVQNDESSVEVRNYEVSKSRERLERTVGEIENITASILLNHKTETVTDENGEEITTAEPYEQQEIEEIRNVMAGALGIQTDRGDVLTVQQIRFQETFSEESPNSFFLEPYSMFELIRWIIVAVVLIVIAVLIYRITNNFSTQTLPLLAKNEFSSKELEAGEEGRYLEGDTDEDLYTKKLSEPAKELTNFSEVADEVKKFVENNTPEAASYVRSMMSGVLESNASEGERV